MSGLSARWKRRSAFELRAGSIEDTFRKIDLEKQNALIVARELAVPQVIKIRNLKLEGVQIEDDFKRQYPKGEIFSHAIGYVGAVRESDRNRNADLSLNDTVGKAGLEAYYDKEIRGEDGEIVNYRNAKGEVIDKKTVKAPVPGYDLYSTIDAELEEYFYNRLQERLNLLGGRSGVGIALNPQNGEVLALVSLPSFDNNKIAEKDLIDPDHPFFNRAISGVYAPGSTIKPLMAAAGLEEKIVTPESEVFSRGYIEIPNPYNPDEPTRFLDWKPHGWVNLYSALARSSNVYFYALGGGLPRNELDLFKDFSNPKGLGIYKLKEYWQKFRLGELTGIDLPAENKGFLPDPESKEKSSRGIWRVGDTYNVSIGQGDLLITPIQLLNYIAAVANGGKFYKPFLVKKIAASDGKIIRENNPEMNYDGGAELSESLIEVRRGMMDGVRKSYGTSNLLADLPVRVAAKTGTSQVDFNTKTNAFFVGYAPTFAEATAGKPAEATAGKPAEAPQIAILVLIENSREGSLNAVPVAKEVIRWYYENRLARPQFTNTPE
ncbi:hypothetical protein HYV91_01345 [Candidatus Wolfebacteria bacterium]|nr:hypothetical protein [Candidatus Wolfebacteria bacterium]